MYRLSVKSTCAPICDVTMGNLRKAHRGQTNYLVFQCFIELRCAATGNLYLEMG